MIIRCERSRDAEPIADILAEAFADPEDPHGNPVEVGLVDDLRRSEAWIPQLSLVLEVGGVVVGHVVCTRGFVDRIEVLGLGPIGLVRSQQLKGGGSALIRAVLGAAEALGEPLVALLGSVEYYRRFGFVTASDLDIEAPDAAWGPHFQARRLTAYRPHMTGKFRYAAPFDNL